MAWVGGGGVGGGGVFIALERLGGGGEGDGERRLRRDDRSFVCGASSGERARACAWVGKVFLVVDLAAGVLEGFLEVEAEAGLLEGVLAGVRVEKPFASRPLASPLAFSAEGSPARDRHSGLTPAAGVDRRRGVAMVGRNQNEAPRPFARHGDGVAHQGRS